MKVFQVYKNVQSSDGDDWQNWATKEAVSYHSTIEGAESKVLSLIAEKFKEVDEWIGWTSEEEKKDDLLMVQRNETFIQEGSYKDKCSVFTLFDIKVIEVEE